MQNHKRNKTRLLLQKFPSGLGMNLYNALIILSGHVNKIRNVLCFESGFGTGWCHTEYYDFFFPFSFFAYPYQRDSAYLKHFTDESCKCHNQELQYAYPPRCSRHFLFLKHRNHVVGGILTVHHEICFGQKCL